MKISEYILILFATLVFIGIVSYGVYTMSKIDRLAEQTFRDIQNTHQKVDALANTMQAKYLEIAEQIENKRGE
jgi:predicted membrane chloride channel (bestrophin family)